jgi:putative chitinase
MNLRVGSKGDLVKKLQEKLGITADGNFGPGTERAVRAWQTNNKLTVDGIAGPAMLERLGISVPAAPGTATQTPAVSGGPLKLDKLKGHIPDSVISQIPEVAQKFGITSNLRLAHFLAQCGHESGGFKAVQENLNYGAKGLRGIFAKYFPTDAKALEYERKPEKIANLVYGNRMGNGPEPTGEGFKFRGRGYIQLTGKENYRKFGQFIGDDLTVNPDLVATKYPLASAAFFFQSNGLWAICDRGADDATVTLVTKRVNGGTIGLADRIKHFKEYFQALS